MADDLEFLQEDAYVWAKVILSGINNHYYFLPGYVDDIDLKQKRVKFTLEQLEDGKQEEIKDILSSATVPAEVQIDHIYQRSSVTKEIYDLIDLEIFNEAEIMQAIKDRYCCYEMYTYCANTLISMNPNCGFTGEFGEEKMMEYAKELENNFYMMKTVPPHLYSMGVSSLHEVLYDDVPDTSMIICFSGESGSGKTYSYNKMLEFLIYCLHRIPEPGSIPSRILRGHSLLESLGNCKTPQNDNSTRFFKNIELVIDSDKKQIIGYKTTSFFLQKELVLDAKPRSSLAPGKESNDGYEGSDSDLDFKTFHIFYMVVSSMPQEWKDGLKISSDPSIYKVLRSTVDIGSSVDFDKEWISFIKALDDLGLSDEQKQGIWTIISLVLNVSSLTIIPPSLDDDGCKS